MTHNIIKTENYLLIVSDEEIKVGDFYVDDYLLLRKCVLDDKEYWSVRKDYKKIIAHLPLNNSPVLEGIDLLPPLEDDVKELAQKQWGNVHRSGVLGFIEGYNKAKEKYKYTEEDMVIFADWYYKTQGLPENNIKYWGKNLFEVWKSLQQPKMPVGFECEVERIYPNPQTISKEYDFDDILIERKTTTNSQGQTVWVGKYIY